MAMPDGTNPQRLIGYRNLDCPHYLFCLDQAVSLSWQTFSCQSCPHQNLRQRLRAEDLEVESPGWEDLWCQAGWMSEPPTTW